MKIGTFLLAAFLVCVLPVLLSIPFVGNNLPDETQMPVTFLQETTAETVQEDVVLVYDNGNVVDMPVETYITAVVLGEMPADFEMEALKAQAVVARTYTYRRIEQPKHSNAAVCTDSSCCQAFVSVDEYVNKGGTQEAVNKVAEAVKSTAGQVLTYQGAYIEATYFSCSGGRTEAAVAVWGSDVPYLQAVDSPGEENASHYTDTVKIAVQDFCDKIGCYPDGPTEEWIGMITYTAGGGVSTIEIGDQTFSGTQLRRLLNLRSTAFVITAVGDSITVTTKGFGHRVGMSQYGADAMAFLGKDYKEILQHYYQGTELTDLLS